MLKLNFELCDELISTEAESKTGKELSLSDLQWDKSWMLLCKCRDLESDVCALLQKWKQKKCSVPLPFSFN